MDEDTLWTIIAEALEARLPSGWSLDTGHGSMIWVLPPDDDTGGYGIDVVVPEHG